MPRIGITGYTNLTAATEEVVYEALRKVLLPYPSHELVGVSCLARGADQIFAQAVLDLGGALRVVLPAPDYRTKIKPGNVARYDALLDAAESVHVMPFETSRRESYMAGEHVLATIDEIIAVWDGGPSGGLGGTADVVSAARQRGLSVQVVWPPSATRA